MTARVGGARVRRRCPGRDGVSDTQAGDPPDVDPPDPKADTPEAAAAEALASPTEAPPVPPAPPTATPPPDRSLWVGISIVGVALVALFFLVNIKHDAPATIAVATGGPQWVSDVQNGLGQRGYDWVRLDVRDGVATVSGEAPDVDSRQYGFEAAQTALRRADAGNTLQVVVDATALAGGKSGVGAAVTTLGAAPAAADCQAAFQSTLADRAIAFTPDSADLTADNTRLLDALAAVALRCKAYPIEIGGHTEASASRNARLSAQRAAAVEDYLIGKGVPRTGLTARGYGASKPLDPAAGPAADARNRRIEFTVTGS